MMFVKIAVAAAAAVLLPWLAFAVYRSDRRERDHMLDAFVPVFEGARLGLSQWGFPRLEGRLDGLVSRVDLNPDTLVYRSLPTLWLEMRWAQPHEGRLCVTVEHTGTEYFDEQDGLLSELRPIARWPHNTEVCGDLDDSGRLLCRIAGLDLSAYPSLKRLVLTGKEIKVTMRCAQGDRSSYRILRSAKFPPDAVSPALVFETMSLVRSVGEALRTEETARL